MHVWVAHCNFYENEIMLGAFSTEDLAEAACAQYAEEARKTGSRYYYYVDRMSLDRWHWRTVERDDCDRDTDSETEVSETEAEEQRVQLKRLADERARIDRLNARNVAAQQEECERRESLEADTRRACHDRGISLRPGCPPDIVPLALQLSEDVETYENRSKDPFWDSKASAVNRRIEWNTRTAGPWITNLPDVLKHPKTIVSHVRQHPWLLALLWWARNYVTLRWW